MRLYNRYILTVSVCLLLTAVTLIALGGNSLDVYYIVFIVEALIITELYAYFSGRARRGLNYAGAILFAGFIVVLGLQIINILT
ncbi:MAG TPA: hypothetical protein VJ377_08775 [Dehalococcoidales bacterium]|nr:MAG: hypothetical protein A2Z05_03560 [Chloroflexi bacterium RBG_16_60_22]HJX13601.1 hypothetical protein [Dehalococcoidales bacterium]